MRQYLKLQDPDGLIYFDQFKYADISIVRGEFGMRFLNIEVISLDGPYTEEELLRMRAKQLGSNFLNVVEYVHVQLRHFPCNFRTLDDFVAQPLRVMQGYGINIYPETDPIAYAYLGWSMELLHSEISLVKEGNDYYLNWVSNNEGFLSETGGKATQLELCVKVNPHFLKDTLVLEEMFDYWHHAARKKQLNDLYFAIFQALEFGTAAPEGIDIGVIPRGTTPIENSKIAWDYAVLSIEY
jgi:hypothetical protein